MSKPNHSQEQYSDPGQMLHANGILGAEAHKNPANGFAVNSEGGGGGMNKMSLLGEEGIDSVLGINKEGAFGHLLESGSFGNLISGEGAIDFNLLAAVEKFLPGLNKSECYAIKSLGTFLSLQHLSFKSQSSAELKGNTSLIGGGGQSQGG